MKYLLTLAMLALTGCSAGSAVAIGSGFSGYSFTAAQLSDAGRRELVNQCKAEMRAELYSNNQN